MLACVVAMLSAFAALMNQPVAQAQIAPQTTPIAIPTLYPTPALPTTNVTPGVRIPIVMRAINTPVPPTASPTIPPPPTPTPAPVMRCAGTQPKVLPGWFVYEGKYGGLNGVGELCNPLDRAIYIDYSFDALDGQGNIIESISTSGWHPVPAGGVMCTETSFSNRPAAARYQFRVRGWSTAAGFLDL
jgi:hypothetical protein